MTMSDRMRAALGLGAFLCLAIIRPCLGGVGEPRQILEARVPSAAMAARSIASLPATNELSLAIGLPVRDPAALQGLLQRIYDPASPDYHRYLTPAQFAERFGPTAQDYAALIQFAQNNGLTVTHTYSNRLVLAVAAPAAAVERAFQVHLRVYQHPKEARTFYAPDTPPSVDASLPVRILSVSGLDNFALPHPTSLHVQPPTQPGVTPNIGSGPSGQYMGRDFRLAYLAGNKLNGTGQSVALLEFDGYYSNDITAYETAASLQAAPLLNVPVNGGFGPPGANNDEVALDIEMAIAMATNLSKVVVYEAPLGTPWLTMLTQIADDNLAAQISCSWGGGTQADPASEQIFQQMAAQGQSFFAASGDDSAYVGAVPFPDDSPNITVVGGTTLITPNRGLTRVSEIAWNSGFDSTQNRYIGTGGGVSPKYSIPVWQQGISSVLTNGGSTSARNVPDVALTADNIYVKYGNGQAGTFSGTSCAAPLWAGLMALVNQQAVSNGLPVLGFINPAIYEIANESVYSSAFFDITTGSNAWVGSPKAFFAVPGYDLCTGLGVPKGTNLISLLVAPDPLIVVSNGGFRSIGTPAGAFSAVSQAFSLTNLGSSPLSWSLLNTPAWLTASNTGGTLAPGASDTVVVGLNAVATNLIAGTYTASLWFSNNTTHVGHSRFFSLKTSDPLVIQAPTNFVFAGPPGGPFLPAARSLLLTNASPNTVDWGINPTPWLDASPAAGSLAPGAQISVAFVPSPDVTNLADGLYFSTIQITNLETTYVQGVTAEISVGIVQNGGFETGDFTAWTLVGHTFDGTNIYDGVVDANALSDGSGPEYIHSGNFGAFLGDTTLATLSQTFQTTPGQSYRLSFWVDNPVSGSGQQFFVNWITNGIPVQILSLVNPPVLAWTNAVFVLSATDTNTTLQFEAANPPGGFGLDDITVDALSPPVFTSQPTNLTVLSGASATFSGTVKGIGPMTYQWLDFGTNVLNGANIAGATSSALTISAATLTNAGNYALVVTNSYGSVTSSVAVLTVIVPPSIGRVSAISGGAFNLNLLGTPGYAYVLEVSTNLVPPISWNPLATNTLDASGVWSFADFSVTNTPLQFYRLRSLP